MKKLYAESYCLMAIKNLEELKSCKWPFDNKILQKRIHSLEQLINQDINELYNVKTDF
jgi:hypothetical protein